MRHTPSPASSRLVLVLLSSSCVVPVLVPTGSTVRSGGARDIAFVEAAEVRAWAHSDWSGRPADLAEVLTPVHLTLENESNRTLRLSYEDVVLVGASGTRYAALPPFEMSTSVSERASPSSPIVLVDYHPATPVRPPPPPVFRPRPPPVVPRIHVHRFNIAPPYAHFYFGLPFWNPWVWNGGYYARYSPMWPQTLPTEDMLQQALPEGALDHGGVVSGFLYFQSVRREPSVQLEVRLHDAATNEEFGVLRLPFQVCR